MSLLERGGRVISSSCFRLLSLQAEVQNETEVLKPILEELEVMRLSCALGMLSNVNAKELEFDQLDPSDFDDDFARFLRSDIFGRGRSGSNAVPGVTPTEPTNVRVVGLFGKRREVKAHLNHLKAWDNDMERRLSQSRDQGIYAVLVEPVEGAAVEAGVPSRTLVMFCWLDRGVFDADRLRDTATYILRFLTCLTNDVTCCLADSDVQLMEKIAGGKSAAGMGGGGEEDWKSYSVAFHVEQQRDQEDDVRSRVTQILPVPHSLATSKKLSFAKGVVPMLYSIIDAPVSKRTRKETRNFVNMADFCNWIKTSVKQYELKCDVSGWTPQFKKDVLVSSGAWPKSSMDGAVAKADRLLAEADARNRADLDKDGQKVLSNFEQGANIIFRAETVMKQEIAMQTIEIVEREVEALLSGIRVLPESKTVLSLPQRMVPLLKRCLEYFEERRHEELDLLLNDAAVTMLKDREQGSPIRQVASAISSWFGGRSHDTTPTVISAEFRARVDNALEMLKEMWMSEIKTVMRNKNELQRQVLYDNAKMNLQQQLDAERDGYIDDALVDILAHRPGSTNTKRASSQKPAWGAPAPRQTPRQDAPKQNGLAISFRVATSRFNARIAVEFEKEELTSSSNRVVVASLKFTNASSAGAANNSITAHQFQVDCLGDTELAPGEEVLGLYSISVRTILLVTTSAVGTSIRKVVFPTSSHRRTEPTATLIRSFPRVASLCDFNVKERVLALVDPNRVNLYRFNDTFGGLEVMRTVDVHVKTSLAEPLQEVLLADGTLYMVDQNGAMQSLNTRNQQTSRKHNLPALSLRSPLFVIGDSTVLGWTSGDGGGAPTSGRMRFVSADNMRELPQSESASVLSAAHRQPLSSCFVDDSLFVFDEDTRKIQVIEVEATLKSDSYRIRTVDNQARRRSTETNPDKPPSLRMLADHWLWTFYHLYEKFPVRGELYRGTSRTQQCATLEVTFAYDGEQKEISDSVRAGCQEFFREVMNKLENLNKPLYGMDLSSRVEVYSGYCARNIHELHYERLASQSVASFLRELITFVPIQICRAEHNTLTLMRDGQDKPHVQHEDGGSGGGLQSADIAQTIRFGLLSPLLQSWRDQCVVITSMGKQSTGKSYFLNHLTGTSFAISGARCTDGAWMSLRVLPAQGVLLVVIDFEGLGSFERTEQEDVFLSVLNASLSMLTIFRMEMRLDKEIDDLFAKFQKGSQLLKSDPRLFRGKLYMAVKDVNPNDQKNVVGEFVVKFQKLLEANKERNFLTDMYAGQLDINCSPPLGTLGYYRSLTHAQQYITTQLCGNPKAGFQSGKAFLDCLRLLLAKITILDWTSLDDSAIQFKVAEASRQFPSVLRYGGHGGDDETSNGKAASGSGVSDPSTRDELVCVKTGARIVVTLDEVCAVYPPMAASWRKLAASSAVIDRIEDDTIDFGPALTKSDAGKVQAASATVASLFASYCRVAAVAEGEQKKSVKALQHEFDVFLAFAVRRRCLRVEKWSRSLFGGRVPEQWMSSQSQSFGALQTLFVRCLDRCAECQLGCMKVSSHAVSDRAHDCGTSHSCDSVCAYCSMGSDGTDTVAVCAKPAGHDGLCECASGEHTCTAPCDLHHAVNCSKVCSKKTGHEDSEVHRCSVSLHKCGQPCEANDCKRLCVHDIESPHTVHKCEVDRCLCQCIMEGCDRQCSSTDHFHGKVSEPPSKSPRKKSMKGKQAQFDAPVSPSVVHMCSEAHACPDMCAQDGVCHIDVVLKKSSRTFVGARGTFQYTFQEMNGSRKKCARRLEPGQMAHNGAHSCDAEDQENRERRLTLAVQGGDDEEKTDTVDSGSDRARVCHYCDVRCPCCSYYCQLAHGHTGLHQTSHGNMRNTMFLSEDQEIDVMDRKYAAGERGTAEMCNLYCSKMGRAHVHFLDCDQHSRDKCIYTGSSSDMRRHCTRVLEPKPDHEQDEVLHERFWDTLGWEDPCASTHEKEEFRKCGYKCDAPEHEGKETSFCVLPAWHAPETADTSPSDGSFSIIDGHKFECTHIAEGAKMHHVFVLDSSGSMSGSPWTKLMGAFHEFIHNRILVGSTQDLVSVVTFGSEASIAWEAADISTMTRADVPFLSGGTSFGAGLRCATEVLSRMDFEKFKPVVIFFSDGQPGDAAAGDQLASHMAQTYAKYGLEAFAVGFGDVNLSVLRRVAERLGGTYHQVLSGDELKQTFQTISASVGARAGLALTKPIHEMVCVICQKELATEATTVLTPCQHELHRRCFRSLSEQATKDGITLACPSCRRAITV